jgi:acyl dehydratase
VFRLVDQGPIARHTSIVRYEQAMPLNRAFVGREYPAEDTYEVSRELIRRFADAIGDASPVYRSSSAAQAVGHPDVIAPPTFLTVLGFRFREGIPAADPELGLDYSRVVHGEMGFEFHRPVVAGDRLTVLNRIVDIRDAGANELMKTETVVSDSAGQPVATLTSTLVSRGTAVKGA